MTFTAPPLDYNARPIARDEIAGSSVCSADDVTGRSTHSRQPIQITSSQSSGSIRPDEVALDNVVPAGINIATDSVAGDDVAGSRGRASDLSLLAGLQEN